MKSFSYGGSFMKRFATLCLGTTLIFSAVSCVEKNDVSDSLPVSERITFSAGLDGLSTRTSLAEGRKVYWTEGDRIAVLDNVNLKNNCFTAENIQGAAADFSGEVATKGVESYVAVYPWTSSVAWSTVASKYETVIPHYQKAVAGGFDTNLNLAVAKTSVEDMHLSFRNMCALVKVTVPTVMNDVTALTLMSGEFLTGRVLFSFDEAGNPVLDRETSTQAGFKEVTLAAENGAALVPGDYYFVVRPSSSSTSDSGVQHSFTVGVTTTAGVVASVKSSVKVDVAANDIINLGTLSLEKAAAFRVTNAPVGDFPAGVESFQIQYEGNGDKTVTFSARNSSIATVDANGLVSFTGTEGTAHIFAVCDGVNYPLVFNITKGYYAEDFKSEAGCKWALNSSHVNQGASMNWFENEGDSYLLCTPYLDGSKGRADIQRSKATTYLTRKYPVICFRIDDVNDKRYARNITLDTSGKVEDGTTFSGGIGSNNNKWVKKYKCLDGSAIIVYDLSKQGFGKSDGTNLLPEGTVGSFTTFQLKYADIKQGNASSFSAEEIAYRMFWFRTFPSMDAMNAFLEDWSANSGITYTE